MTKQEAIERAWTLLEALEALPNGVDITVAEVRCYSTPLQIHLNGGIDRVARKLGKRVATTAKTLTLSTGDLQTRTANMSSCMKTPPPVTQPPGTARPDGQQLRPHYTGRRKECQEWTRKERYSGSKQT